MSAWLVAAGIRNDLSGGRIIQMRIAYCEDEKAQAIRTADLLKKWANDAGVDCRMEQFPTAESFLFTLNGAKTVPYDLVLLDISMEGMDGFSLAKMLREKDRQVRIAFLTSDPSHVFEGYEIEAWRYILKPLDYRKVSEMMDALTSVLETTEKTHVMLEIAGENVKVFLDDVLYVEVNGHYTTIICSAQTFTVKESFKNVIERFNQAVQSETALFIKCHRSAAVNITKVQRIGRTSCVLTGDVELPVSRGMYQQLNQAFIRENLSPFGNS